MQPTRNRQTDSQNKTELRTQSAWQANRTDGAKESPRVCSACRKNAGAPGAKAAATAAGRARTAILWRGAPGAEKPLRTGKIRVRSFACPEGPCEPGPPKNRFAVFGWHGLFLLRIAHCAARGAAQKGAPPPFIPCKLFEKSLSKNFIVWPGGSLTPPRAQQRGAQRRVVPC